MNIPYEVPNTVFSWLVSLKKKNITSDCEKKIANNMFIFFRQDGATAYTACNLTFQSLAVSLRTTRFNIQKFYMVLALR